MGEMLREASLRFGQYELVSYLGSGGMSDVYVALHTGLQKRFALKILRASLRADVRAVQRFRREGECAARVSHPNVVDVSDVGVDSGVPYLVMELLQGETLAQTLQREGRMTVELAVDILLPLLEGIAAVHAAAVVHRDIKPANILLARAADGSVKPKLVDFGIAKLRDGAEQAGCEGQPIGTPHYMSPEQARGESIDERSDQYSIGSVLFEMLSGREPYRAESVDEVLAQVARGSFPSIESACPRLPPALASVLARATARNPAHRFASISDLSYALVPFASARTRKLWLPRDERDGVSSAQLWSGAFRPQSQHDPRLVRPSGPRVSSGRAQVAPRSARGFAGALLVALGLLTGAWVTQGEADARARPAVVAAPQRAALESVTSAPLTLSTRSAGMVRCAPLDALVSFDGKPLGRGIVALPPLGDRLHELRVSAPGYIERVVLFHGALQESTVVLERRK